MPSDAIRQGLTWSAVQQGLTCLTRGASSRPRAFGCLEHPIVARLDPGVLGPRSDRRNSVAKQLANGRRTARHAMLEAEIVHSLKLLGREHDLQPLFSHQ